MEDKELQELFDAKRTVEANRHRQEKLRRMLAASAAPKSRRLWPVWALSAAASIALLLITLPLLFRSETAKPLLVAEATEIPTPKEETDTTITSTTSITRKARKNRNTRTLPEEPLLLAEAEVLQPAHVIITEREPEPVETVKTEEPIETLNDTPRIHRRTSSQMVCSNCNIYNVPSPSTALQDFLAATFGTETSTPITLKTIEF
ncbi:MAG: hypothetical protein ACSW8I_10310 [bacterium]